MRHLLFLISLATFIIGCKQTTLKSPIVDNLKQGDTLTLFAEYTDCGEWGGHIEKVFIFKKADGFWATFYKDTVSCDEDPNTTRKKVIEKTKALSTVDRNEIVKYVDSLKVASKRKESPEYNALNDFIIFSKDTVIEFHDWTMNWDKFKIMKTKIFE